MEVKIHVIKMTFTSEKLDSIALHFILCTERTGSSLLSLMLNLSNHILSPSEEPFALYFYKKYRNKEHWTEKEIDLYVDEFYALAEKNTDLYFSDRKVFTENLKQHINLLNWSRLIKLTYLHFIDTKEKSTIEVIIDKQIKYFFHLKKIQEIFPNARFIVLVRDVRDNIVSKRNRKLNWNQHPLFLTALWRDTYRCVSQLPANSYITIRYEDLMEKTKETMLKICEWVNVNFEDEMLNTEGKYLDFIHQKKNQVNPEFINHLMKFHSGLSQPSSTKQIGQYKDALSKKEIDRIEQISSNELSIFGYTLNQPTQKTPSISSFYFIFLAKVYRRWLLSFYFKIPLHLKLKIKKFRKKKYSV